MIHISALGNLTIDKHKELGILSIIPLADLGANTHKDGFAGHALRDSYLTAEPIMLAMDTTEVAVVTLEFAFKLVAAIIGGIPAHIGSKLFPGRISSISLLRTEELTLLILPAGDTQAIRNAVCTQLIQDDLDTLI